MAQGPRPAKAQLRSAERARTSQMIYFQTRNGPLRFFSADRVQRPPQLVRGAMMLVRKTCSINCSSAAAPDKGTFDRVISGKLQRIGQMIWA